MPFLNDEQPAGLAVQSPEPLDITTPSPPFRTLLDVALRRDNTMGSVAEAITRGPRAAPDIGFDPFKDLKGYEDFASSFIGDNSDEDVYRTKQRIDLERRRANLLASGGAKGVLADVMAGVADPVNLIPIGGEIVQASRFGRVLVGAGRVAAAGALSSAAGEAIFHATQETRTGEESALNIAAATLLGGVLGGAVSAIGRPVSREIAASAARDGRVFDNELGGNIGAPVEAPSVGATAARDTTLAQETFTSALGAEKALAFSSPTMRLGSSPSVEVRRIAQELAEQPLELRKNVEGIASPISVESRIRLWQAPLAEAATGADDAFVRYRLGRDQQIGDQFRIGVGDTIGRGGGKLAYGDFMDEVGRAMRRNDQSDIPEVAQAAKLMREKVFDPLKDRAIAAGLLPEDVAVDTALSYLTRVYDVQRIVARRPEFEQILTNWLTETQSQVAGRVEGFEKLRTQSGSLVEKATTALPERKMQLDQILSRQGAAKFEASDRALRTADRQHREAVKRQTAAEARQAAFTPTAALGPDHPLPEVLKHIRQGKPAEPPRLVDFLRRNGGLQDQGGEATALGVDAKSHPRLVRKEGGMNLDDAALKAWEAGYLPEHAERPTINEFLDALGQDVRGDQPRYAEADRDLVAYRDYLDDFRGELEQAGIDPAKMSDAEIGLRLEGKGEKFREATPAAKAKAREIGYYARRAGEEADKLAERVKKLQAEWDHLKGQHETDSAAATALKTEIGQLEKDLAHHSKITDRMDKLIEENRAFARSDTLDIKDMSRQITDTLLHQSPGRTLYTPVPLTRGPLRERTLNIPDAQIEDFLESDIGRVARIYTRTMGADTELAKVFGRADMDGQFATVNEHYAQLRAGVTDEAAQKRLDGEQRADLRDLSAVRDRVRGTYGLPENPNGLWSRAYTVVRDLNYLRLMGGMTLSSLSDMGSIVMVHGLNRVFGEGLVPMVRDFGRYRLSSGEVKLAGTALDMVLDTRAMSLADVLDDYGRHSKFERGLQAMTSKFGLVTLMAPWNAALKQFAGVISQTRALKAIATMATGAPAKPAEVTRLAKLGIGPEMIGRIAPMFEKHGSRDTNIWWANTKAWEDTGAAEAFRAAMGKEVDMAIVQPGQERPLWMTKGIGKVIGQFRSFSMASTQRVMISGLQRRDMATLNGMALMTALGMLTYFAKQQMAGQGDKLPGVSTPGEVAKWVAEGLDRGGLTGWLFDANNMIEKMTSGAVGMSRLTGQPTMSRYASRGVLSAILGPTAGFVEDLASATQSLGRGDWSASDSRAVRRMIPLQNLIGIRHIFDAAETGINHALGVPDKKPTAH